MENKRKISKWDPGRHRAWFRHLNYKRTDLQHLNLIVFHQRSWLFFLKHVFKCIYFSLHCFRWGCPRCVHAHPLGYCIFFPCSFFFFFYNKNIKSKDSDVFRWVHARKYKYTKYSLIFKATKRNNRSQTK